jgi:hypothetical protein
LAALYRTEEFVMPNLQLDLTKTYPVRVKRDLAKRFGEIYADVMQTTPDLVDVTFRELGEGGLWRCGKSEPVPAVTLICDIRRGRPPEQRERLGRALVNAGVDALSLDPLLVSVEFTQHSGDEIYRSILIDGVVRGGLSKDWSESETATPLVEAIRAEHHADH